MATDRPLTEVLGDAIERVRRDRRQEGPTMPAKYRKKPVEIEAMRWDGTSTGATPIIDWVLSNNGTAVYTCSYPERCASAGGHCPHTLTIRTLEGDMRADVGDWIIRGVKGEFYPCKNEIFWQTYEPVEQDVPLSEVRDGEAS